MNLTLSPETEKRVEEELAAGRYQDANRFIEDAVQYFLNKRQISQERFGSLRRVSEAVDKANLYKHILIPS